MQFKLEPPANEDDFENLYLVAVAWIIGRGLADRLSEVAWRVPVVKAYVQRLIFSGSGVWGGNWPAPAASRAHRSRGAACREMASA